MRTKIASCMAVLALLIVVASCGSNPKVIFNPDVESNDTEGALDILKIELSDTATIVHFDIYLHPDNWFRISSKSTLTGDSGRVYNIIGSNGITLDKKERTPADSGLAAFTLTFEPLAKGEKAVDFSEGNGSGDWRITGIKLYQVKQPKSKKPIQCTLKGEVVNRPYSHRLALIKLSEDMRTANVAYIPIRNGKFEYVLNCDHEEIYELIFLDEYGGGSWYPIKFFSEKGTINFTLYPMEEHYEDQIEHSIKGGRLNTEYSVFRKDIQELTKFYDEQGHATQQLMDEGRWNTPEVEAIFKKLNTAKDSEKTQLFKELNKLRAEGKDLTIEAQAIDKENERISQRIDSMELKYANDNQTLVGYAILYNKLFWATIRCAEENVDIAPMVEIYSTIYAPKYPKHPYTEQMQLLINAVSIKVGGKYIDVEAINLQGEDVKLSEQIQGKVAFIHLWASWCSPCRRSGRELIPVYEAYKNKGFTVVGIARETAVATADRAIKKDKYPWLNLVELNDREKIWMRYGLGNAGGGGFLVDEKGVILAVNPTAEEVEKILKERLK